MRERTKRNCSDRTNPNGHGKRHITEELAKTRVPKKKIYKIAELSGAMVTGLRLYIASSNETRIGGAIRCRNFSPIDRK
jgi:hypothetical protein